MREEQTHAECCNVATRGLKLIGELAGKRSKRKGKIYEQFCDPKLRSAILNAVEEIQKQIRLQHSKRQ
jgi:hypothetical protein